MYIQRLRELRESKKLLQRDLAALLGITQSAYSQYERGVRYPPPAALIKLADFYQVSVDDILCLAESSSLCR